MAHHHLIRQSCKRLEKHPRMKKSSIFSTLASLSILTLLTLSLISCQPVSDTLSASVSTSTVAPYETLVSVELNELEHLEQYVLSFNLSISGEGQDVASFQQNIEQILERSVVDDFTHVILRGLNPEQPISGEINAYITGEQTIVYTPLDTSQPCQLVNLTSDPQLDMGFILPQDIFATIHLGKLVEEEVMTGGFSADHYRVDGIQMKNGSLDSQRSEVWLEHSSGLMVAFMGYANGNFYLEEGQPLQNIRWDYSLALPEEKQTYTLPEACSVQQQILTNFPTPNSASHLAVQLDIISFEAEEEPLEVADFYRSSLPPLGWTIQDDQYMAPNYMLILKKGEKVLKLVITPRQPEGSFVVVSPSL